MGRPLYSCECGTKLKTKNAHLISVHESGKVHRIWAQRAGHDAEPTPVDHSTPKRSAADRNRRTTQMKDNVRRSARIFSSNGDDVETHDVVNVDENAIAEPEFEAEGPAANNLNDDAELVGQSDDEYRGELPSAKVKRMVEIHSAASHVSKVVSELVQKHVASEDANRRQLAAIMMAANRLLRKVNGDAREEAQRIIELCSPYLLSEADIAPFYNMGAQL